MGVAVKGKLDARVAGEVLDVHWVRSPREQDREAGVPEIVPAYLRQPPTPKQGLEVSVDYVLSVQGSAFAGGEHEAIILPVGACSKLSST